MAVDVSGITTAITEGQVAAVAVALAVAIAYFAIRAAKLIRQDGLGDGAGLDDDDSFDSCANCGQSAPNEVLEENGWMCQDCHDEGKRLCRRCGDAICDDPEYQICPACER